MKAKAFIYLFGLLACFGLYGNAHATTTLTYDDFTSSSGYALYGSATNNSNTLQLTTANEQNETGSVFFTAPVHIDRFSSSFSFEFSASNGADGLVFVIKAPDSGVLGGSGGSLGYASRYSDPGIEKSIGIEFDISLNNNVDPSGNHIGLNVNGSSDKGAAKSLTVSDVADNIAGSGKWYSWIDYDGTELSVYLNKDNVKPTTAQLTYNIDISEYVGGNSAVLGFTAATGSNTTTTLLHSFNHYSPHPEPSTYLLMGIGGVVAVIVARKKLAPY